ncbi:MAG: T9SS type A sorting domain-containing protein [Ignavibacteriota bacterium]
MQTTFSVLLFILFFALPCFAQAPRIDSIAVDEDKGELVLHGLFTNSSQAIVAVDSVSLPVTLASDTFIRATIPVSGKGAAGWVKVIINGIESNQKLITYWHIKIRDLFKHIYSDGGVEFTSKEYLLHVRYSFSVSNVTGLVDIPLSRLSTLQSAAGGNDGINGYVYSGPKYHKIDTLKATIRFNPKNEVFLFDQATISLDMNYSVISGKIDRGPAPDICAGGVSGYCYHWDPIAPTDFPPPNANVQDTPSTLDILQAHLSSNPVASNAETIITLHKNMRIKMQIMDILGSVQKSDERMLSAGENRLPLNASALATGVYFCRLQAGGEVVSMRFVKE